MISISAECKLTLEEHHGPPYLRWTLLKCAERDQTARAAHTEWVAAHPDEHPHPNAPACNRITDVDEANLAVLRPLLNQYGWLGSNLVGIDGAHACWLLAHHAPSRYRIEFLPLLIKAVAHGHASATDLAHLHDRVAVDRRRPQAFGTQRLTVASSSRRLWPIENGVNTRRAAAGLAPLTAADLASSWSPGDLRRIGIITRARCC